MEAESKTKKSNYTNWRNNKMTQEEILLATLTTDSNGECTYTYTGTGAGKIDLKAKYRSLQSEIYELIDALFYDSGLSENTNWYGRQYISHDIQTDGHLLSNTGTGVANYLANDPSTPGSNWADTFDWENCEWKFEIVSYTGTVKYFNQNGGVTEITSTGEITVTNNSSTKRQAGLQLGAGATVKYRNFRLYPL